MPGQKEDEVDQLMSVQLKRQKLEGKVSLTKREQKNGRNTLHYETLFSAYKQIRRWEEHK